MEINKTVVTATPERELSFRDDAAILKNQESIELTKPKMDNILAVYNAIQGVPELSTAEFQSIFDDPESFAYNIKLNAYNETWLAKHEDIGLEFADGFKMVKSKLPDTEPLMTAVKEYYGTLRQGYVNTNVASHHFYEIIDGKIEVNQEQVERLVEINSLYWETPEEFKMKAELEKLIESYKNIMDVVGNKAINMREYLGIDGNPLLYNLGALSEMIDFGMDRFDTNNVFAEPKIKRDFIRKLKADLKHRSGL